MVGFPVGLHPVAIGENGRIQRHAGRLLLGILRLERIVRDGVDQAGAVNADGALQADPHIGIGHRTAAHLQRHVVGILRNVNLRIDQAVGLPILKPVAPLVRIAFPVNPDFVLVNRSLEGGDRLGLRHAGERTQVVVLVIGHHQKVAVAPVAGAVAVHPPAMAVTGMAGLAGAADIERPQPVEGGIALGEGTFKEIFPVLEGIHQTRLLHCRSRILVGGGGNVEGGAQLAASIGLLVFRIHIVPIIRSHGIFFTGCKKQCGNRQQTACRLQIFSVHKNMFFWLSNFRKTIQANAALHKLRPKHRQPPRRPPSPPWRSDP